MDQIIEMGVAELEAIFGDQAPRSRYAALLRETHGDVQRAVHRFLDGSSSPQAPSNAWTAPAAAVPAAVAAAARTRLTDMPLTHSLQEACARTCCDL